MIEIMSETEGNILVVKATEKLTAKDYATLSLTSLHVYLNWGKVWRYLRRILSRKNKRN